MRVWVDADGLAELFGKIDTPAKAWVMVQAAKEIGPHECASGGGWFPHVSGYRRLPGGFEIRAVETVRPCRPLEVRAGTFFVGTGGEVTVRGWQALERSPDRCVVH